MKLESIIIQEMHALTGELEEIKNALKSNKNERMAFALDTLPKISKTMNIASKNIHSLLDKEEKEELFLIDLKKQTNELRKILNELEKIANKEKSINKIWNKINIQ